MSLGSSSNLRRIVTSHCITALSVNHWDRIIYIVHYSSVVNSLLLMSRDVTVHNNVLHQCRAIDKYQDHTLHSIDGKCYIQSCRACLIDYFSTRIVLVSLVGQMDTHTHMHTHIHKHHTHTHACTHIHMCARTPIQVHIHMHTSAHIHAQHAHTSSHHRTKEISKNSTSAPGGLVSQNCFCPRMSVCACVCVYVFTHVCVCVCVCLHMCVHPRGY